MALNSNFVINRLGFMPCQASGEPSEGPGNADSTYTASRLGLTFVRQAQPDAGPAAEASAPILDDGDALDSRMGICKPAQGSVKVGKPFWPRFRKAAAVLAVAVKDGILGKLTAGRNATPHIEALHDFVSHRVESPAPKTTRNQPLAIYRKGTYKLPSELMARLKTCAAANHEYQYRLVIESLDEFLTANGFAPTPKSPTAHKNSTCSGNI